MIYLLYPADPQGSGSLIYTFHMVNGPYNRALSAMRRVPLLRALLPPPQRPRLGAIGIFRVRIRAAIHFGCNWGGCVELELVDPDPSDGA